MFSRTIRISYSDLLCDGAPRLCLMHLCFCLRTRDGCGCSGMGRHPALAADAKLRGRERANAWRRMAAKKESSAQADVPWERAKQFRKKRRRASICKSSFFMRKAQRILQIDFLIRFISAVTCAIVTGQCAVWTNVGEGHVGFNNNYYWCWLIICL